MKMNCPKDANQIWLEMIGKKQLCNKESKDLFSCTRKQGHKGLHHAHSALGRCYKTWLEDFEMKTLSKGVDIK